MLEVERERAQASTEALEQADESMQAWQEDWTDFNGRARDASEKAQVERARIEQLENQLRRFVAQRERTLAELDNLSTGDLTGRVEALERDDAAAQEQAAGLEAQLQEVTGQLEQLRERQRELVGAGDQSRHELQQAQGRLVSLEALQRAALGQAQGKVTEWLSAQHLSGRPRLAQQLHVAIGWERAVETVLGAYLEAVCVDDIDAVAHVIDTLAEGTATFLAPGAGAVSASDAGRLLAHVQGPSGIERMLGNVLAVDSLSEALQRRAGLAPGESIITRDGIWIGSDWLRVSRDQDVHAGVLAREQEMRGLRDIAQAAEQRHASLEAELQEVRSQLGEVETRREDVMVELNRLHRSHSDLKAQLGALRMRMDQARERIGTLRADNEEIGGEIMSAEEGLGMARGRLQEGLDAMEQFDIERSELEERRERLREALSMARAQAESDRESAQQTALSLESKRSALASILAGLERMQSQLQQLQQRREELQQQLASGEAPLVELDGQLAQQLERRLALEEELSAARHALETVDARVRELDEARMSTERRVEEARHRLEEVRLGLQESKVRRESFLEQFQATQFELDTVLAQLPPEAEIGEWERLLGELGEKIARLGQVNLAAISEFQEQSERKEYLDRQFADLTEALETLENAMHKIDKETRARFQDTFDRVNAGLKERFPRLFGGGHAYLELTGEDVLNAGVAIMARPPGKRNSTINQLSGGEKALTAVALVFSIFELNPAPFCLLDEVDAPLDDNNVGRFCDTVRDMSQNVQFIFITHNKNTMELASQLLGVTMHEAGVSRLVAVDTEEAVRLAAM